MNIHSSYYAILGCRNITDSNVFPRYDIYNSSSWTFLNYDAKSVCLSGLRFSSLCVFSTGGNFRKWRLVFSCYWRLYPVSAYPWPKACTALYVGRIYHWHTQQPEISRGNSTYPWSVKLFNAVVAIFGAEILPSFIYRSSTWILMVSFFGSTLPRARPITNFYNKFNSALWGSIHALYDAQEM